MKFIKKLGFYRYAGTTPAFLTLG